MKMRLQIASVLPAPAKAEPAGSHGKGMFGTTLQGMMGTPDIARTPLGAIGGPPGKLAQLETNIEVGKPGDPIEKLAGQVHRISEEEAQTGLSSSGSFHAQPADQREQIEGLVVSQPEVSQPGLAQPGLEGSAISKKPLANPRHGPRSRT